MKQDFHVFQGMKQDNHPIRQESKYLWEAHNIRFTAREGNTLLSMTNERGTEDTKININGAYIGHCIVGEYLVVFTRFTQLDDTSTNCIYRVRNNGDTWECTELYRGELNMDVSHPAQTLGIYEGDLVQKVYWVDGKNQPRSINIVADRLLNKDIVKDSSTIYPEGCFDFVQELTLSESIEVNREEGGGSFSPGTIQYAFSYYNKYGQESNLFYATELLNTSFSTRGGSPEDVVSNTFHISINNVDSRFQYLRIYSIHRTSLDATPTVKIVTDIEITSENLLYIDTGLTGTDIDPTKMLYIGGESIIANTIAEKDNTLFLGNIELKRKTISEDIKEKLKTYAKKSSISSRTIKLDSVDDSEALYEYSNQLSAGNTSSYKVGDVYRLGLQFQYKTGKWSEPIWIGDYEIPRTIKPHRDGDNIVVPAINLNIESDLINELSNADYKRVRPLVVLPSIYDRMTLAQGILCPTVFSVKDRLSNTPFAQSSWFFRPMSDGIDNTKNIADGATVSYGHMDSLKGGSDRGAEIQNMVATSFTGANNTARNDSSSNLNTFFVDQSILTMHSPDIEFDSSTKQAIEGNNFDLNIVGVVPFKSNAGDISIQTSSAVPAPNDTGFFHRSFLTTNYSNKGMVAGMFYKSHIIDEGKNANEFYASEANNSSWELNWLVYPWHRTGSLNNDVSRPENKGTRTSVLKRKVISNLRFSPDTIWANTTWSSDSINGITQVSVFDSNEISLVKIPTPANSGIRAINYYGNVDTLVTTDKNYTMYLCPNAGEDIRDSGRIVNPFTHVPLQSVLNNYSSKFVGDYAPQLKETKEPVRMKYKSTAHAVFAFNYKDGSLSPVILPTVNSSINKYSGTNAIPFWSNVKVDVPNYDDVTECEVEEVYSMSGNSTQIEQRIVQMLEGLYGKEVSSTTYAICTCSTRATDNDQADLYENTGSGWSKVNLQSYQTDKIYKATYSDSYWKVQYNGSQYALRRQAETDTYHIQQGNISVNGLYESSKLKPFLFIAELRRKNKPDNMFGGDTEEALRSNLWIPAGKTTNLGDPITFIYGDTYYQRYDCLKTYAFTSEDENSVVEIASFMCETRTNIDGRYDRNRGQISNLNMSPTNFNLLNPIYSQRDNFFNYRILEKQYYRNIKYPTQIIWSQEKTYLEDVDTWANITLANSIDLSGNSGSVTSIESFNDLLIAFQEKSISQILFNSRVQIPTSDGTPVEISNSYKVDGSRVISDTIGCQDKWAMAKSSLGIYFVDSNTDTLYLYNGQLQDLSSQLGGKSWLIKYHPDEKWNIQSLSSLRLSYDPNNKDLYLSPKGQGNNNETLCYSEQLGQFTSLMSYNNVVMFPMGNRFLSLSYNSRNKATKLWENFKGDYNSFYDEIKYPSFTYICNEDAAYTKIFDTIEYRADLYNSDGNLLHNESFDWIQAYNEYQNSGEKPLSQVRRVFNDISLRKKFRVWRGQIPRDGRTRMRNPWTAITLGFSDKEGRDSDFHFVLHDISTKYTV